jgi:hypothetical protein
LKSVIALPWGEAATRRRVQEQKGCRVVRGPLTTSIAYEGARRIGFSLSTLYRHMLGGRTAVAKSAKIIRCLMVLPDRVLGTAGDQFALVAAPFRCVSSPPAVPATTIEPPSILRLSPPSFETGRPPP